MLVSDTKPLSVIIDKPGFVEEIVPLYIYLISFRCF